MPRRRNAAASGAGCPLEFAVHHDGSHIGILVDRAVRLHPVAERHACRVAPRPGKCLAVPAVPMARWRDDRSAPEIVVGSVCQPRACRQEQEGETFHVLFLSLGLCERHELASIYVQRPTTARDTRPPEQAIYEKKANLQSFATLPRSIDTSTTAWHARPWIVNRVRPEICGRRDVCRRSEFCCEPMEHSRVALGFRATLYACSCCCPTSLLSLPSFDEHRTREDSESRQSVRIHASISIAHRRHQSCCLEPVSGTLNSQTDAPGIR